MHLAIHVVDFSFDGVDFNVHVIDFSFDGVVFNVHVVDFSRLTGLRCCWFA